VGSNFKRKRDERNVLLALGDNSSALGWLPKANIDNTKNLPLHMAARKYAKILLQADCCLYSQHIADTFLPRVSQSPELPKPITHYTRISIPKLIANSHLYHPSW
jgi:hypothetical protein